MRHRSTACARCSAEIVRPVVARSTDCIYLQIVADKRDVISHRASDPAVAAHVVGSVEDYLMRRKPQLVGGVTVPCPDDGFTVAQKYSFVLSTIDSAFQSAFRKERRYRATVSGKLPDSLPGAGDPFEEIFAGAPLVDTARKRLANPEEILGTLLANRESGRVTEARVLAATTWLEAKYASISATVDFSSALQTDAQEAADLERLGEGRVDELTLEVLLVGRHLGLGLREGFEPFRGSESDDLHGAKAHRQRMNAQRARSCRVIIEIIKWAFLPLTASD